MPFYRCLDLIILLALAHRRLPHDYVELFGLKGILDLLGHFLGSKVRQQVGDGEYGIARIFTDTHGYFGAVLFDNGSVQGQRDGKPVVFADTAVVVGFRQCNVGVFIKRSLLEIQTRAIAMRAQQTESFAQRTLALSSEEAGLVPVEAIHLRRLEIISKPGFFHLLADIVHDKPFGFAFAQKFHIPFGHGIHGFAIFLTGIDFPGRFRFVFEGVFFTHEIILIAKSPRPAAERTQPVSILLRSVYADQAGTDRPRCAPPEADRY